MEPTWTDFWFEKCLSVIGAWDTDLSRRAILWRALCLNPNLTIGLVLRYPEMPWDFGSLSSNPSVATPAVVAAHPDLRWKIDALCGNPNFKWDDIVPFYPRISSTSTLAQNPNITTAEQFLQILRATSYARGVSRKVHNDWALKPFVTVEFLRRYPEIFAADQWKYISQNPVITWQTQFDNPLLPWDIVGFAQNPNITEEILLANRGRPWRCVYGMFPSIPPARLVELRPRIFAVGSYEMYGFWNVLARHPLLTFEFIEEHWADMRPFAEGMIGHPSLSRRDVERLWVLAATDPVSPLPFSARIHSRYVTLRDFVRFADCVCVDGSRRCVIPCPRNNITMVTWFVKNPFLVAREEYTAARRARLLRDCACVPLPAALIERVVDFI